MDINYKTLTLLLVSMTAGMSQAYELSELNKALSKNKPQLIKEITKHKIPSQCIKPSPVVDIWLLEPLLVKEGLIKQSMSRNQKREVIQEYIRNKNSQYTRCIKSLKPAGGLVESLGKGPGKGLGKKCRKPALILDDRMLEALLIKDNQIDKSMNKQQRQDALQAYKNKKKAQFRLCKLRAKQLSN